MKRSARPKIAIVGALLLLAVAAAPGSADAQGEAADGETVRIELRVWQDVDDDRSISVSARPADGSWQTLGIIPLALDDGHGPYGVYRYGDITLTVPLSNRATPVHVEMRVWQHVKNGRVIYISARASGDSWATLGTIRCRWTTASTPCWVSATATSASTRPCPRRKSRHSPGVPGVGRVRGRPRGHGALRPVHLETLAASGWHSIATGALSSRTAGTEAIRRIAPDGTVTTIAGGNGPGLRDGPAATAQFEGPTDVAIAHDGAIYVADSPAHRIRKITPDGMVTTVAGGGPTAGSRSSEGTRGSFRDGPADEARFAHPQRIALGPYGDLFIIEQRGGSGVSHHRARSRRSRGPERLATRTVPGNRRSSSTCSRLTSTPRGTCTSSTTRRSSTGLVPTIRKIDTRRRGIHALSRCPSDSRGDARDAEGYCGGEERRHLHREHRPASDPRTDA